jgi:hypothetical protein
MNPQITFELKPVHSVRELQQLEDGKYVRRIGMPYFQRMPDGGYIFRVVTAHTNGEWLIQKINEGVIYIPEEKVLAEVG